MDHTLSFLIEDPSQVANARREVLQALPRSLYGELESGEVSIIVTEFCTNILKHAEHGELLVNAVEHDVGKGLEIIALDKGPGITNIPKSMVDGYSTAGSPGTGLGAIDRLSASFQIHTQAGKGTAMIAQYTPPNAAAAAQSTAGYEVGGINVPLRGEAVCGDDWDCRVDDDELRLFMADGLGHGPDAYRAAALATKSFREPTSKKPEDILEDAHFALRSTRGAAASVAVLDPERQLVRFYGIGNVSGVIAGGATQRRLPNANGTLGHVMRKGTAFHYPWNPGEVMILHSDGVGTQWSLEEYAGLIDRSPSLIAAVIYRDYTRHRDDASVVVARRRRDVPA